MGQQIADLVAMRDIETLYELMAEDDDWMIQLDAAEGLVKLGDIRGLEFLRSALQSEEKQVRDVAGEILANPVVEAKRAELEADADRELRAKKQAAVKRLQSGRKVFQYKMLFMPAGALLQEDPDDDTFRVPVLTELGLEGWEVAGVIAHSRQMSLDRTDPAALGNYLLLKRELAPSESGELE